MYRKQLSVALFLLALSSWGAEQKPAPATSPASGDGEYRMGPEDVIQVWVWKEPDLSTTAVVRPDGKLSLPLIGELDAKGRTATQLQGEVKTKLATYIAEPVVTVIVREINFPKISVLGQVHKPDVYKIRQKTTVLDAIALAGGFTDFAKRDKVVVIRNTASRPQRIQIDLKRPDEDRKGAFYLEPSDTVYVQ
ncbi:MAG: polysaccharide biosynthesis/export family protein [Acidobacteria bacterium]|nr:polysaccharide biosynthesis/export family protein [Acidobacteriota bacterium]